MTSSRERLRLAFSETSDPVTYVPRDACEGALAAIRRWGDADGVGSSVAALVGTPGLGKTMILRVTEARVHPAPGEHGERALYLPYASLDFEDLVRWSYGLLGRGMPTMPEAARARDATASADEHAGASEQRGAWLMQSLLGLGGGPRDPLYLIIDDADSMPPPTVEMLLKALPRSDSPVRFLLALNPDSKATRLLAALHALNPTEIRFRARMNQDETATYLRTRARRAGLSPEEIERIDESAVQRIHSLSGGIPRRAHRLAAGLLEDDKNAPRVFVDDKREHEGWMGRPMAEDGAENGTEDEQADDLDASYDAASSDLQEDTTRESRDRSA